MLHALEEYEIYISTKSACSDSKSISKPVYALTSDEELAKTSLRISISSITTKEEIDYFIEKFDICYNRLTNLRQIIYLFLFTKIYVKLTQMYTISLTSGVANLI